ncbi:hypothetical protein E1265_12220 [Streptomyces sp. 8K308]|uniref:hypothetical protein n=1 Tax=Streptomyces sp. 8K308 TaxID=2530388 RepID=UPI0010532411|nr:hypothetical protein [Streptomyces sp. 8K308]TDC23619.1 hypothetical protein E1265_12220 [Streptomyces sp. 8K308]
MASAATMEVTADEGDLQVQNWSSSMTGVLTGFQSRRWADENYTELIFRGCTTSTPVYAPDQSTEIDMRHDRTALPDISYGRQTAYNCFDGPAEESRGEWNGLEPGDYFFQITRINDSESGYRLSVDYVAVDTTAQD